MYRGLWIVIILTLVLSSISPAAAILNTPPGGSWTGILSRNTADVNGYLSMIEEARQGNWRMRNLFTAEPHAPFQIRPLWLLLGLIGRLIPALSNVLLMEIARVLTSFGLLLAIAAIARKLFRQSREQIIALLVMTLGSGLGWMRLVNDPPDLRIVETSTFLTLISPPLYALSLSLVLVIILFTEKAINSTDGWKYGTGAGLCALWLGFDRPFSLVTLGFAVAGFVVVRTVQERKIPVKTVRNLLPLLAGALAPILYQIFAIQSIPVYSEWNKQHVLPTPPWANLLTALGLLIPLALPGARPAFRTNRVFAYLCAFYIAGSLLLSHLRFGFQERFLEGLPVMTAMFASFGLLVLVNRASAPAVQTLIATIVIALLSFSHFIPLQYDLAAIARQSPPQYMPDRILDSMRTLKKISEPGEAILSTESTGNFLVAYTGRPVVIGQKIQTARYLEKYRLMARYFKTLADSPESRELFLRTGAKWLFWGPEEAWMSGGRFHPSRADYLMEKHNDGFIRIFKLK